MICPDCKNEFVQQFVCTTCGAEKLYDATVETLRNQLAAAQKDAKRYRWLREQTTGGNFWVAHGHLHGGLSQWNGEPLDAAVDAAMKECGK